MATILVPSPAMTMSPHTPDAAQLRMIALSVAEAALDSPNLNLGVGETIPSPLLVDSRFDNPSVRPRLPSGLKSELGRELWNIAEQAVQRREKENASPSRQSNDSDPERAVSRSLRGLNISSIPSPRMTRSADPSPIKSSFDHLDQTRSPPIFVPRFEHSKSTLDLSGRSSPARAAEKDKATRGRFSPVPALRARIEKAAGASPRHSMRLPSLAQITAKMKSHHRRRSSHGDIPQLQQTPARPAHDRKQSAESVEILQTPVDEVPSDPRVVSAAATPVSEVPNLSSAKESRLAPLIRERTAFRAARPRSMPPLDGHDAHIIQAQMASFGPVPHVQVIMPTPELDVRYPTAVASETGRRPLDVQFPPILSGLVSPTKAQLLDSDRSLCTPPPRPRSFVFATPSSSSTVASGSGSSAASSPTLSVPIITCTPAPERTIKNGVEQDSDEEGEDVVVFDAREQGEQERARRGDEMKRRLSLRRGSE